MHFWIVLLLWAVLGQENETKKTVFLSILARDKAHCLPYYLNSIDSLDYDKRLMTVYINTNNNQDRTEEILRRWAKQNASTYRKIIFEAHSVEEYVPVNPHEWTLKMLGILGRIRNRSLEIAIQEKCDYYFVIDCDNFLTPHTLTKLMEKDKPIIAPMLTPIPYTESPYSNFFYALDEGGYWGYHPDYYQVRNREKVGTFLVPVAHCTYLIKGEYLNKLTYVDGTNEYEFLIFSRSAREQGIEQYICNEEDFGVLLCGEMEKITLDKEKELLDGYFQPTK